MKYWIKKRLEKIKPPQQIFKDAKSDLTISSTATIKNSTFNLNNSKVIIGDNVSINGYNFYLQDAVVEIRENTIFESEGSYLPPSVSINNGRMYVDNHTRMRGNVTIRFGGALSIGEYTAINENTLIRCDEKVSIGSYCMISYECLIFDSNTHTLMPPDERRALTKKEFPTIGQEYTRPKSKPVSIGNDCWIGQRAVILKGVDIRDKAVIGTAAVVTKSVEESHVAYGNPAITKKINEF